MKIGDFSKFNKLALAQLVQVGLCGRHDAVRCGAMRYARRRMIQYRDRLYI